MFSNPERFSVTCVYVYKVAIEPLFKDTPKEDISFNQDSLSCPKGVQNEGVPLYLNHVRVVELSIARNLS